MEKHFNFEIYKFALFLVMFFFFGGIALEAFEKNEWVRFAFMFSMSITGLVTMISTYLKKKPSNPNS